MRVPAWRCTRALSGSRRTTPSSPFRNPKRPFRHSNSSETSWRNFRGSTTSGATRQRSTGAGEFSLYANTRIHIITAAIARASPLTEREGTHLLLSSLFQGQPHSREDLLTRAGRCGLKSAIPAGVRTPQRAYSVRKEPRELSQQERPLCVQEKNERRTLTSRHHESTTAVTA